LSDDLDDFDVLVACECSGVVRDALLAEGVRAISCDLKPTQRPGPHYQGDVLDILHLSWRGLIAHPVCRYLTNAGAKHLYRRVDGKWAKANGPEPERWRRMQEGAAFFRRFDRAEHIPHRVVENPIMHGHAQKEVGRKPDQYVQPWWFGDPFSKATGLHLTALPPLVATHAREDYPDGIRQEVWLMAPGPDREEKRSQTYPGFARAMARQWAPFLRPQC